MEINFHNAKKPANPVSDYAVGTWDDGILVSLRAKVGSNTLTAWVHDIPRDYYLIVLLAVVAYFIAYVSNPYAPGNSEQSSIGWFSWYDQGRYLDSAKAIATWSLSPESYIYPLGYPLLAVPFLRVLPRHPFLIPNLFFSVGIVVAFYASCCKVVTRVESAALTLFLVVLSANTQTKAIVGGLIWSDSLTIPWNLIPVFFAAYVAIWLLIFDTADFRKLWIVSLAIAVAFFSRPPDVLFLGLLYLGGLTDLKSLKEKTQGAMILIFPCCLVLATTLVSKWAIFHSLLSPYDIGVSTIGFSLSDLPFKFYVVFFDGSPIYGYKELLLLPQMPWLLICVPGIIVLAKLTNTKSWFLMASIGVCLTFYVSMNGQAAAQTFNYHGYRYFVWVFPYLGLCAYLTLTRSFAALGKWKTAMGIAGGLVTLVIGWNETVVATILPATNQRVGQVSQLYEADARKFSSEITLSTPTSADGIRIMFSKGPSINMQVAKEWQNFTLIVDGKKQTLFHDYSLYQSGNVVYVAFRNAINRTGQFQQAAFQYDKTDDALLDSVVIVKKKFESFAFISRMLPSGVLPSEWYVPTPYEWGTVISMGAGGNAGPYRITGWSDDEVGYTWSEGHHAVLGFRTSPVTSDLTMNLDAVGLDSPIRQSVKITVNGRPLKRITLPSGRQNYGIDIPFECLRSDGLLMIQFDFPNATTPLELGMNQDKRVLSMAVFKLALNPKQLQ